MEGRYGPLLHDKQQAHTHRGSQGGMYCTKNITMFNVHLINKNKNVPMAGYMRGQHGTKPVELFSVGHVKKENYHKNKTVNCCFNSLHSDLHKQTPEKKTGRHRVGGGVQWTMTVTPL